MLISIGIPTANKPLELESALSSVLSAEVPNGWEIEIIICINCDSLYLEEYKIFEKKYMKVPNLRISRNETKLNMTENWDKCINMMRGDYITILGDDDALLPYSFKCLEKETRKYGKIPICWRRPPFYWKTKADKRPKLFLVANAGIEIKNSLDALDETRYKSISTNKLPGYYNGFIPREVVKKIENYNSNNEMSQYKYFVENAIAPDLSSSINTLYHSEIYGYLKHPLSLSGISKKSNGYQHLTATPNQSVKQFFESYGAKTISQAILKIFPESSSSMMFNASEILKVHLAYSKRKQTGIADAFALIIIESYCACELPYSNKDKRSYLMLINKIKNKEIKNRAIKLLEREKSLENASNRRENEIESIMVELPEKINDQEYTVSKAASTYKEILYNYIKSPMQNA